MEHECTLWLASMNVPLGNFMDVGLISYSPKLDGDYDLLIMVVWYTDIKLITLITYWWLSRWRFGTWTLFFHILRISYSQLTNSIIFQRGGEKPPTSYVISIYNPSFITIYNHFYWYYNHYFYIIPLMIIAIIIGIEDYWLSHYWLLYYTILLITIIGIIWFHNILLIILLITIII
jgi:hypothetical protein